MALFNKSCKKVTASITRDGHKVFSLKAIYPARLAETLNTHKTTFDLLGERTFSSMPLSFEERIKHCSIHHEANNTRESGKDAIRWSNTEITLLDFSELSKVSEVNDLITFAYYHMLVNEGPLTLNSYYGNDICTLKKLNWLEASNSCCFERIRQSQLDTDLEDINVYLSVYTPVCEHYVLHTKLETNGFNERSALHEKSLTLIQEIVESFEIETNNRQTVFTPTKIKQEHEFKWENLAIPPENMLKEELTNPESKNEEESWLSIDLAEDETPTQERLNSLKMTWGDLSVPKLNFDTFDEKIDIPKPKDTNTVIYKLWQQYNNRAKKGIEDGFKLLREGIRL